MVKKTKIAIIGYGLYAGGAEANAIQIAYSLNLRGIKTDLILFKKICEYKDRYKELLKRIKVIYLLSEKKLNLLLHPICIIFLLIKLFLRLNKKKYTVLIAMVEGMPFYLCVFFAKLFNSKSILIVGNNIGEELKTYKPLSRVLNAILLALSFRHCNHIVCVSAGLKLWLKTNFKYLEKKVTLIYNGIDNNFIKESSRKKLDHTDETFFNKNTVVVTYGRLIKRKGQQYLIGTLKYLNSDLKVKLLILGKGKEKSNLLKLTKDLNCKDKVQFLEPKNPYKYLRRSKIFVFLSHYEGFGNVILEAMSCELPIVSVDCHYGPREILDENRNYTGKIERLFFGKYGILIPSFHHLKSDEEHKNEKILAFLINKVVTSPYYFKKYKAASLIRVKDFSSKKMVTGYLRLIENLIK